MQLATSHPVAPAPAGPPSREPPAPPIEEAIQAFRLGRWRQAVALVEGILADAPDTRLAIEIGARAACQGADWPAAARYYQAWARLDPRRCDALVPVANALIERGDYLEADRLIEALLERQPGSVVLLCVKLVILGRLGDAGRLAAFAARLHGRDWRAEDAAPMLRLAQALFESGAMAPAAELLDRIEALGAASAEWLQLRARIAFAKRRYADLGDFCARLEAAGNRQQQFEAQLLRARAAHNSGDPTAATRFFAAAFAIRPDHEESAGYLVQRHLAQRDVAAAEAVAAAFAGDATRSVWLWCRIQIHDAKGDKREALALILDGLARFPADTRFARNAAEMLLRHGEVRYVLRLLDPLLAAEPGSTPLLRLKLTALARLGDTEAVAAFAEALLARPWQAEDAALMLQIAQTLFETGRDALGNRWLERIEAAGAGTADLLQLRARAFFGERRYDELGELCARLAAVGTPQQQFEAHLLRARAAHNTGDATAATRFFAAAFACRPDHEESAGYLVRRHLALGDVAAAGAVAAAFAGGDDAASLRHWWQVLIDDATGEREPALARLLDGIARFGGDARYLANAAEMLLQYGETRRALRLADGLLEAQPESSLLLRIKVAALARLGDAPGIAALAAGLRRREWRAADAAAMLRLAQMFFEAGQNGLANEWLDRIDALASGSGEALQLRARIAFGERRYDALHDLCARLEAIGNPQQQFEAQLLRARAAHNSGDAAMATRFFAAAFAGRRNHEESAGYLVQRHLALHDVAAAETVAAGFAGGDGAEPLRYWWRILIHDAKGEREAARALLRDAAERFAEDTRLRSNLAGFLTDRGESAAAMRLLEDGLQRTPRSLPLLVQLLQCRLRGNAPAAEVLAACDRVLEIDPRHQDALLQRGNSLTRLARRHEALTAYQQGTRLFPANVTFWRSAVATSLMLGDEDTARSALDEARRAFAAPGAPNLVALADIFDAADAEDEALRLAAAALAADPELTAAQQIAARLFANYGYFDRAWPPLLRLQQAADRHLRTVQTFAQVAAGRDAARRLGADAPDARYPETLFQAIAGNRPAGGRDAAAARSGIVHVISTLAAGGSERQLAATVAGLAAMPDLGEAVALAVEDLNPVYGRDFFLPQIVHSGIDIRWLDEERLKGQWRDRLAALPECAPAVQAIASMPIEIVKLALPLYAMLLEKQPRAVQLWQDTVCVAGGVAAMLAGIPCIVMNTRSTRPIERQRARRYLHAGFGALLSRPGTVLVNNSRAGARDYEAWLGLPAGTVRVVHNGYDFAAIRARADAAATLRIRAELGIAPATPVLGGVMRCSFEKRPELWTEAAIRLADRMPDLHAILVGDGPMAPQLRERVREAGHRDRIHFVGQRTPVEPWLRAMDVLFLSSLTEGMPNVLIEAQALGVPVATMRIGGAPETVAADATGIVIDNGPIAAIAGPIGDLLCDPERRARFGASAPGWVESEFGMPLMLRRLLDLYRAGAEAAAARPGGAGGLG